MGVQRYETKPERWYHAMGLLNLDCYHLVRHRQVHLLCSSSPIVDVRRPSIVNNTSLFRISRHQHAVCYSIDRPKKEAEMNAGRLNEVEVRKDNEMKRLPTDIRFPSHLLARI